MLTSDQFGRRFHKCHWIGEDKAAESHDAALLSDGEDVPDVARREILPRAKAEWPTFPANAGSP